MKKLLFYSFCVAVLLSVVSGCATAGAPAITARETGEKVEIAFSQIVWPDTDIAKLIPIPPSFEGNVTRLEDSGFTIHILLSDFDDYSAYVKQCIGSGFNMDIRQGEDYYFAYNPDGYELIVNYYGNSIMFIRMEKPAENLSSAAAEDGTDDFGRKSTATEFVTSTPSEATTEAALQDTTQNMVWIPTSGSKYHASATCSGMKNPSQVTLEYALSQGYEPCKRCH